MTEKLTVLVPCKDEERNLPACLASIRDLADEILVADSGSTDRSLAIAADFGARIIEREYINSADMKNWAIPQASHPYVFVLDADERVAPELGAAIRHALEAPNRRAYKVRRRSFVFGHPIRFCGWQRDVIVRLIHRDTHRYDTRRVHAAVDVPDTQAPQLSGDLLHYTYWDLSQFVAKLDRYTSLSAHDLQDRDVRATFWRILFRPPTRFFKQYILRQGFRDGLPGLVLCGLAATNVFLKYAKLWVMQNGLPQPDPGAPLSPPRD